MTTKDAATLIIILSTLLTLYLWMLFDLMMALVAVGSYLVSLYVVFKYCMRH